MKKDYIRGLGDTADLAIVGGRRDAKDVAELYLWPVAAMVGCREQARGGGEAAA
jgi:DNA ligase 4